MSDAPDLLNAVVRILRFRIAAEGWDMVVWLGEDIARLHFWINISPYFSSPWSRGHWDDLGAYAALLLTLRGISFTVEDGSFVISRQALINVRS